ncbi:hypothetical protein [Pseudomonas sp. P8_250]|uniref:hypothetical protein n=1 Tax=Pseudomonas sp. P8_250 TaxID=3043446 RepID=UPI002A3642C2|nr:hypothetical protein [Pseudomonas sp. P8_250]MDX9668669.1 hypothetical protein [Pseudomonas sp. P8_250]
MQAIEHPLDKYIFHAKHQLSQLPEDNTQPYDTSQLQLMCLEKFANFQGYSIEDGLFVTDNKAASILTLDNMRSLYNNTMAIMGDELKGHAFVRKVYLSGRSFRKPVQVQQHWVAFL